MDVNNTKKSPITRKTKKSSYSINSFIMLFLFASLILLELFNNGGYLDELIGIFSAAYLIFFRRKLSRYDAISIIMLFCVVLIGLFSNIVYNVNDSISSILIDVIAETKLLFAFFAAKYYLSNEEKIETINLLVPLAKIYTFFAFICSIISLFFNIGMSGSERYGLSSFRFIFDFNFQYVAVYMLFFGVIVCNTKMKERSKAVYYVMGIISLVLATKAPPILFSIIFILLYFYFKKHQKLSLWFILLGAVILVIAGWFQIEEYLMNGDAPRRLFFDYSIKTANDYFPLGSGFGTFGSDQAARNYSKLYYQYGFDQLYGMNPENGSFLSDTFWPMALGQFGWIGSIIYLLIFVRIFITLNNNEFNNAKRAFLFAIFLQYIIHAIGSAILSSSSGMIGFVAMALFSTINENERTHIKNIKVRI